MAHVLSSLLLLVLVALWTFLGLMAFIQGVVCANRAPSIWNGTLAVAAALLLGPFYFVFPAIPKTLCPTLEPKPFF